MHFMMSYESNIEWQFILFSIKLLCNVVFFHHISYVSFVAFIAFISHTWQENLHKAVKWCIANLNIFFILCIIHLSKPPAVLSTQCPFFSFSQWIHCLCWFVFLSLSLPFDAVPSIYPFFMLSFSLTGDLIWKRFNAMQQFKSNAFSQFLSISTTISVGCNRTAETTKPTSTLTRKEKTR